MRERAYWGFESVGEATYLLTARDIGPVESFLGLFVLISERSGLGLRLGDESDECDEFLEESLDEDLEEGLEEPFEDDLAELFEDDWRRFPKVDFGDSLYV